MLKNESSKKEESKFFTIWVSFLNELYEESKEMLDAAHRDPNLNRKKKKAWNSILKRHTAWFPLVSRTKQDLHTKLSKLEIDAKEALLTHKKSCEKTGGGKAAPSPKAVVQKVLDIYVETALSRV